MRKLIFILALILLGFVVSDSKVSAGCSGPDSCSVGYQCNPGYEWAEYRCDGFNGVYCASSYAGTVTEAGGCPGAGCSWSESGVPDGCTTWALPPDGTCDQKYTTKSGDCCDTCPACTPTSCDAVCPTGCGYGGGTVNGTDNCGNGCSIGCGATAACCSPNCDDSGNYCVGVGYTGNCGQGCTGTQAASCTNPATVCSGTAIAPSNGCGTCPSGTKCDTPATPTLNSPVGGTEVAGTSTTLSWNNTGSGSPCGGLGSFSYCVDASCNSTASTTAAYSGAGGSHTWNVKTMNYCGVTGGTSANGTFCLEAWTSARVSAWGAYGACNASHVRTRTRTCTEDCSAGVADCSTYFAANCPAGSTCATTGGGLSWTQTETQTCYGQMTGTFFDASDLSACPATPQTDPAPKISGGTMTLSGPGSYGPYTTAGTGLYTTSATVLSPDTYTLTVNPGGGFVAVPKFNCQGITLALIGSAAGCLTQPCEVAPTTTHDYGFWRVYGGWWQGQGGSAYGGAGIQSNIPGTVPAASRYLILRDADLQDGLAQIKSGTINLGTFPGVTNSVSDWNATSGYSGDNMDYDYFVAKMGSYSKTAWDGASQPTPYTPGGNDYEIYTYSGNVTMNWSPAAGEKVIYLIDGNVTVSANVTVPTASATFLAVIASGTITFNSGITSVDGWWIGNSLNFASAGVKSDTQFVGNGSFIGWSSITLARDLTGVLNNSEPAEKFTFRPDLIINAPSPLTQSKYQWRQK